MQTCLKCGTERHPKSKPGLCLDCKIVENRTKTGLNYLQKLTSMGFVVHTPQQDLWDKSGKFDVTNSECGHRFSAQGGNILNGMSKCSVCGPKKRIAKALDAYKRRYGRNYDLSKKEDYYKVVMGLSRKNFHQVSTRKQHMDHIIPIDWGFKSGAPVEMIADKRNLRLLSAQENISKGSEIRDFTLLKMLCEDYGHPLSLTVDEDALSNKIFGLLLKRLPSLFSKIDSTTNTLTAPGFNLQIVDVKNPVPLLDDHIVIFSDEIEFSSNSDRRLRIIVERLLHKSGKHSDKVYARKCQVREIDALTSSRFLDSNHFQGRGSSRIKLGLYQEDELVAVMTFGKPRFAKGYDWELIRYASKSGVAVVGGASKLLHHFRINFPGSIISYSDKRWGSGGVYAAIGMMRISMSKPNYWWVKDGRRISRYQSQLKQLAELLGPAYNPALSENDNMTKCGWTRLQDKGNDVFAME